MKEFRLAWNGDVMSKRETWTIIGTVTIAFAALFYVLYQVIVGP